MESELDQIDKTLDWVKAETAKLAILVGKAKTPRQVAKIDTTCKALVAKLRYEKRLIERFMNE